MKPYLLALVLVVAACSDKVPSERVALGPLAESGRFKVSRVATFHDDLAYDDERGIYVLTDTSTGREYVGISGVGISELGAHKSGKSTVTDER